MKTHSLIFVLIVLFSALFLNPINAQTLKPQVQNGGGGLLLVSEADVIGTATVHTPWVSLANYDDASFITYPPSIGLLQSSVISKPHITTTIEVSFDAENVVAVYDTTGAVADSSESLQNLTLTTFNTGKYPYYRYTYKGETGNPTDSYIQTWTYLYKKDSN